MELLSFIPPLSLQSCKLICGNHHFLQAYSDYLGFVLTLNDAVKGKSMGGDYKVSEVIMTTYHAKVNLIYSIDDRSQSLI